MKNKTPVSLGLLGAAGFMVIADARVIDPLLRVTSLRSEFTHSRIHAFTH